MTWHGHTPFRPDWSQGATCLGMHLKDPARGDDVYVVANAHHETHRVVLTPPSEGRRWHLLADTYREPPGDVFEEGQGAAPRRSAAPRGGAEIGRHPHGQAALNAAKTRRAFPRRQRTRGAGLIARRRTA